MVLSSCDRTQSRSHFGSGRREETPLVKTLAVSSCCWPLVASSATCQPLSPRYTGSSLEQDNFFLVLSLVPRVSYIAIPYVLPDTMVGHRISGSL